VWDRPTFASLLAVLMQTAPTHAACAAVTENAVARTTSVVQNVELTATAVGRARHAVATASVIRMWNCFAVHSDVVTAQTFVEQCKPCSKSVSVTFYIVELLLHE